MAEGNNKVATRLRVLTRREIIQALIIAVLFIALSVTILNYKTSGTGIIELGLGDVATQNVLAPQQITYISEIETEAARDRARNAIATIYTPPNPKVAREQVERLRQIFDFLEAVRADPYGSLAEKSEWIAAITDLSLNDTAVDEILIMNEAAWPEARQEAQLILNQAMRAEIREQQIAATRRQLPTLVALDTPDEQANFIVAVTEDLIKANSLPDENRTTTERDAAAAAIAPIEITIERNEAVVEAGKIVTPARLEAITALNALQEPEFSQMADFAAPIGLMILITVLIGVYLYQYDYHILINRGQLILLTLLLVLFIAVAKFMIPISFLFYLYPIAALTMIIVTLIDVQLAFIVTVLLAFVGGYIATDNAQEVVAYFILSGWVGVLALGRSQRMPDLLRAGVYVGVANIGVILMFNFPLFVNDPPQIALSLLSGGFNVVISVGLTFVSLLAIGSLAGWTTSIQLSDLTHPTRPLLRKLLLDAPGTYHHSLMVGNLAEQAAERIGADALLVRVMAYYHDIGKIQRPYFFVENQPGGINVHEKLEPQISAQIIISHVTDGLELAKKYRLPTVIRDGISQHQGTDIVKYFYYQAVKIAEEKNAHVDENHFRYPGPRPQTKETGILMLADICESSVRAMKPNSAAEIDEIVQKMIADKVSSGQLDECDLTIADLHQIRRAFVDILQGVHHPRIKYPKQTEQKDTKSDDEAAPKPAPAVEQQHEKGQPTTLSVPPDADPPEGDTSSEGAVSVEATTAADTPDTVPSNNTPANEQAPPATSSARPAPLVRRE